jgi:hypothetical protein
MRCFSVGSIDLVASEMEWELKEVVVETCERSAPAVGEIADALECMECTLRADLIVPSIPSPCRLYELPPPIEVTEEMVEGVDKPEPGSGA